MTCTPSPPVAGVRHAQGKIDEVCVFTHIGKEYSNKHGGKLDCVVGYGDPALIFVIADMKDPKQAGSVDELGYCHACDAVR